MNIIWNKVTPLPKSLAVFAFIVLIGGAFYFGAWYQAEVQRARSLAFASDYKYVSELFGGEIPAEWNAFFHGGAGTIEDFSLPTPADVYVLGAFSNSTLTFGDWSAGQVNFYFVTNEVAQKILENAQSDAINGTTVTSDSLQGVPVSIVQNPRPTNEALTSKEVPGGTDYIIGTGESPNGKKRKLLIRSQGWTGEDHEQALKHYLETADFTKGW